MGRTVIAAALAGVAFVLPAHAADTRVSVADSFRIGTGGALLCTAQGMAANPVLTDMFDRGYAIACRDASVPVGELLVLRAADGDRSQALAARRAGKARCQAETRVEVEGLGAVRAIDCTLLDADVAHRAYLLERGKKLYVAEGLAGYDSALRLGLRSLVADRPVEGEVQIATTGIGNPASFARVQAGTLDPARALAEAYRRNNSGSYAESAEFFAVVRNAGTAGGEAEALVNEAIQKSNLGRFAEADVLFARAEARFNNDPVVARQLRNYRAMHHLNQGHAARALEELDRPLPESARLRAPAIEDLVIDADLAKRLNGESHVLRRLGSAQTSLTVREKAQILDGQAAQLRGTVLRLTGDHAGAATAYDDALAQIVSVRDGKLLSLVWMRAQVLGERAAAAEAAGNGAEAERLYRESVALLESDYPGSAVLLGARGRLAGYLARSGQAEPAAALFREIVKAQADGQTPTPGLSRVLAPYTDLLLARADDPQAVADLFEASQVLVRPGVAQTQAVLARELSAGSDEAARLFRQAVSLNRQIERARIELSRLETLAEPTEADAQRAQTLAALLAEREAEQVATQARLSEYPRFRAVTSAVISLPELQAQLRPGEAYYKMARVDDRLIALLVTPQSAKAFRIAATPDELEAEVTSLRETISATEQGQHVTYAFDVALSRAIYQQLFAPVHADLAQVRHLIFEPDGAMLKLPPNLLLVDDRGMDAYRARARTEAGEFDFTGLSWLGRDRDVSTSVSARAFRDVRTARRSSADREYLGLGQNAIPAGMVEGSGGVRGLEVDCALSLTAWNRPISPEELQIARDILAEGNPQDAEVLTRDAFTDTALKGRTDLSDYRIIHFATHGIVTAPRPRCPAQPALMTSFGGEGSDGLLTFREIFDLDLDADLVILSACDTAGTASDAATREAGLAGGGEVALDGLVRAFVGAGGRLVIASHWPVPDDYDATQRLISGLFTAPAGTGTAGALRLAQRALMDDPDTSHPFYWSGFATIGDGATPVRKAPQVASR